MAEDKDIPSIADIEAFGRAMEEMPDNISEIGVVTFIHGLLDGYEIEGEDRIEVLTTLMRMTDGVEVTVSEPPAVTH